MVPSSIPVTVDTSGMVAIFLSIPVTVNTSGMVHSLSSVMSVGLILLT